MTSNGYIIMRWTTIVIGVVVILSIAGVSLYDSSNGPEVVGNELSWDGADYVVPVREALARTAGKSVGVTQIGITSHHLPVAARFIAAFYRTLAASDGPRRTFVVVGPDHFERCRSRASTTTASYRTAFGTLQSDEDIIRALVAVGVGEERECFVQEHSIGAQAPYIRSLFPDSRIVPITLSSATDDATLGKVADVLMRYQDRITLVASVDFAHYRSADEGRRIDAQSEDMISKLSVASLSQDSLDSPPSIRLAVLLAQRLSLTQVEVVGRANSVDFTGETRNTTGYRNIFFRHP